MKKAKLILILVVLILGTLALREIDLQGLTSAIVQDTDIPILSAVKDNGNIQLYFCPREKCEEAFIAFLESAEKSIHCALYEVELESLKTILLEKQKEMDVQVVTDSDYAHQFEYPFVHKDSYGLMHNKFCIVDGKKVSTGSMNPTLNDAHKNNNNLLLIESQAVAQNYEAEFQELWGGVFKKGDAVQNPTIALGNITLETYFCPDDRCAEEVKEELQKATESIYFMTFSFTHEGIANVLLLKHLDGVVIKGVMERTQISEYSKYEVLRHQLGEENVRKDGNKNNMHHKVFIIDGQTVVTGSFNPTGGGNERNDENLVVIHDPAIAARFLEEFGIVWTAAGNTTAK